eukprot:EG_transcript_5835
MQSCNTVVKKQTRAPKCAAATPKASGVQTTSSTGRKQPQKLRQVVYHARGQSAAEDLEGATEQGWTGEDNQNLEATMLELQTTRRAWEEQLAGYFSEKDDELRGQMSFSLKDGGAKRPRFLRKTSWEMPNTIASATVSMPSSLRRKLDFYRSDQAARTDLQERCKERQSSTAVDWVQYNRVHVMQQTPETELLQRQCEAERRRARAKLVAQRRQQLWQQTVQRRLRHDRPAEAASSVHAGEDLDRDVRATVWITAVTVFRCHAVWLRQMQWMQEGGFSCRTFALAWRVRFRWMPVVWRRRRRRRGALRLIMRVVGMFAAMYQRCVSRRRLVNRMAAFLKTLWREFRFRNALRRFRSCVLRSQRYFRLFLQHRALRAEVLMAQLDCLQRDPAVMGPLMEAARQQVRAFVAALWAATTASPSRKQAAAHRKRWKQLAGGAAELLQAGGVPFLPRLHVVEGAVARRRAAFIAALRARNAAIQATFGKSQPSKVPVPYFPRYLPQQDVTLLLAAVRDQYCCKIQVFAKEIHGRVRPEAFDAALQAKVAQYHAVCLKREAEWVAHAAVFSDHHGLQLQHEARRPPPTVRRVRRKSCSPSASPRGPAWKAPRSPTGAGGGQRPPQ